VTPEQIIAAAKRYAAHVETFGDKDIKNSDNWLAEKSWEKYPPYQPRTEFSADEIQTANVKNIKSGRVYLCRNIGFTLAQGLFERGLVTAQECRAVGISVDGVQSGV
jgi:hypothetical protein